MRTTKFISATSKLISPFSPTNAPPSSAPSGAQASNTLMMGWAPTLKSTAAAHDNNSTTFDRITIIDGIPIEQIRGDPTPFASPVGGLRESTARSILVGSSAMISSSSPFPPSNTLPSSFSSSPASKTSPPASSPSSSLSFLLPPSSQRAASSASRVLRHTVRHFSTTWSETTEAASQTDNKESTLDDNDRNGCEVIHYGGDNSSSSASAAITLQDQKEATLKVWGTLHASSDHLASPTTGSAGTVRITHNLNHGNAKWQASCVEVRPKIKENETDEEKLNPVIAKRNKQFGQLLPWEKIANAKDEARLFQAQPMFPKSNKFPPDDNVEIVFYFETHGDDGAGLKGYQNIASRVSMGELPGECANLTAVGGFATWIVPRSEFVALTESKPLLGEMLSHTPLKRDADKKNNNCTIAKKWGQHKKQSDDENGATPSDDDVEADAERQRLREVTMRMNTAAETANASTFPEAEVVSSSRR